MPTRRPSPAAIAAANGLANGMLLVHFPAGSRFEEWSEWPALQSPARLGRPKPRHGGRRIEWEHVHFFAGPCCYLKPDARGDAALYVREDPEAGDAGNASPFDSGALIGERPRLLPWAGRRRASPLRARLAILARHSKPLDTWRAAFARWLAFAYTDPNRYLEAQSDRYAAGVPNRTQPISILRNNGVEGRRRYGESNCADRRAWTWEVRIRGALPLARVRAIDVPRARLRKALDWRKRVRALQKHVVNVHSYAPRFDGATPDLLYARSPDILRAEMPQ